MVRNALTNNTERIRTFCVPLMLFLLLLQYLPSVLHVTEYLRDLYVQHPGEGKVNELMHKKFTKDVTPANTPPRNSEFKQTRRRRQRKCHLKMQLCVSTIISQLFKVITLTNVS